MAFKTVNGLGREAYVQKAFEVAMDRGFMPEFVDSWGRWFDKAQADQVEQVAPQVLRPFEPDPDAVGGCTGCLHSAGVACPTECEPRPEYYLADLEEVAAAQTERIRRALVRLIGVSDTHPLGYGGAVAPPWLDKFFGQVREELATPGYVEKLTEA